MIFYSSTKSNSSNTKAPTTTHELSSCDIQGPQINTNSIGKKKYFIILPDSTIDNGQDIELDCNDTGSEAIKRILAKSTFIVRFAQ